MNIYDVISNRYSVRNYRSDPVPKAILERCLEAARLAPSAANRQPWLFIVVDEPECLSRVHEAYPRDWLKEAPLIVVMCAIPGDAWSRNDGAEYYRLDLGIAMDHFVLAATSEGLGTCFIAAFNKIKLCEALELPEHVEPVILSPVGYPADSPPKQKTRKSMQEIIRYNCW